VSELGRISESRAGSGSRELSAGFSASKVFGGKMYRALLFFPLEESWLRRPSGYLHFNSFFGVREMLKIQFMR
jgi:hypothetical protein